MKPLIPPAMVVAYVLLVAGYAVRADNSTRHDATRIGERDTEQQETQLQPKAESSPPSKGTILSTRVTQEEGVTIIYCELNNASTRSFWFSGYSRTQPRIQIDKLIPGGWLAPARWEMLNADWCGTGAAYRELEPGRFIKFSTAVGNQVNPIRIGVYCKPIAENDAGVIWSGKIEMAR